MSYGELYIPPTYVEKHYNPVNGRFTKGHVPFNKGKKWSEYLGKRKQKRIAKGWKNLEIYRPTTRPDTAGRCKKAVIAVSDDGTWKMFEFIGSAREYYGGSRENIGRCCRDNEKRHVNQKTGKVNTDHKYNGIRFYFESDTIWMKKIKLNDNTRHD